MTKNNFIFKLSIFHNKCQLVGLLLDVYLRNAFVILTSQSQTHFYTNYESLVLFDNFCQKIQLFFGNAKW